MMMMVMVMMMIVCLCSGVLQSCDDNDGSGGDDGDGVCMICRLDSGYILTCT